MDRFFGRKIDGRFEIRRVPHEDGYLGKGAMGKVYLAFDEKLQIERAIKFLMPHETVALTAALAERFYREAMIATKLGAHQNLVMVHDYVEGHDNVPAYIVMELVRGRPLSELFQGSQPLGLERALGLTIGICAGVGAAHRRGVVHRDVKPKNVIVCLEGNLEVSKLIDFGIAKTDSEGWTQLTHVNDRMGTPSYMAPEQWFDASRVDARADVYSLGCLLYEALAGRLPFAASSDRELEEKHLRELPAKFARSLNIPVHVETIVLRALAKERDDRQPNADALAQELTDALAVIADSKRRKVEQEKRRKEKAEADQLRAELDRYRIAAEEATRKLSEHDQQVVVERRSLYAQISDLESARNDLESRNSALETRVKELELQLQSTSQPVIPPVSPKPVRQWPSLRISITKLVAGVVGLTLGLLVFLLLRILVTWSISLAAQSWLGLAAIVIFTLVFCVLGAALLLTGSSATVRHPLFKFVLPIALLAGGGFLLSTMAMDGISELQVAQGLKQTEKQSYEEAISSYNAAVYYNPNNVNAYVNRGNAHLRRNEVDAALSDYQKAIELDPQRSTAFCGRGQVYFSQGKFAGALYEFNKAISLDERNALAYKSRADCFLSMQQFDRAIKDYGEAMRLDPAHSDEYLGGIKKARDQSK